MYMKIDKEIYCQHINLLFYIISTDFHMKCHVKQISDFIMVEWPKLERLI